MDTATDSQKREPMPTAKAMEAKIKRLKDERRGKLALLTCKMKEIEILMTDKNNVEVKEEALFIFGRFFEEFKKVNTEILPLLEDDYKQEDQCNWYLPKCLKFEDFIQKTESWIEMVLSQDCGDVDFETHDDIQANDSISVKHSGRIKLARYSVIVLSCASSARLKLEVEREELLTHAAFFRKRQDIELEESHLKACNEQLELEAKISTSDAKIKVYADYEDGQDGMNEYYESKVKSRTLIMVRKRTTCRKG